MRFENKFRKKKCTWVVKQKPKIRKVALEDVKYLSVWGVKIGKEDRQQNYIKDLINEDRAITAMLYGVQWN